MQQAGYSKKKIYALWWSVVLVGGLFAALGNFLLPTAQVALLGVCEAVAGSVILALVAKVMMPHVYEEGDDFVSVSTIGGFTAAFLLIALDMKELAH
jgi:zinc transporter ZupT